MRRQVITLTCLSLGVLNSGAQAAVSADFYGFFKASYLHSNHSLSSFGNDSIQAPTEAANLSTTDTTGGQQTSNYKNQAKDSFQIAQTRFGVLLKKSDKLSAKLEFDLADFTNNPIAKSGARLRVGEIYYNFTDHLTMRVGQGWTTFAGTTTFSFSPVAGNFKSGQSGFLAQQVELKYTQSKFDFFGALSQKGRNLTGYANSNGTTAPLVQDVSSRGLPQFIGKVVYNLENQKIGAAYTYAKFDYDNANYGTAQGKSTHTAGGKVFYEGKFNRFLVHAEGYQGSNLGDVTALTLADHSLSFGHNRDIQELGYFTSVKYNFENGDTVYAGYGNAKVTSKTQNIVADKLVQNQSIRAGYSHLIEEGFDGFFEVTNFQSKYTKSAGGKETTSSQSLLAEAGFMYNF